MVVFDAVPVARAVLRHEDLVAPDVAADTGRIRPELDCREPGEPDAAKQRTAEWEKAHRRDGMPAYRFDHEAPRRSPI